MERRLRFLIGALCAGMLLSPLHAAAAGIEIEQTQCVMPEIRVYLRSDDPIEQGTVSAILDGEALPEPQITRFSESGAPMNYFVLLDNSGSVPQTYIEPIKEAVGHLGETMQKQDTLRVYIVGESVQAIYSGNGKDAALSEALEQFTAKELETVLFEGLVQCAKTAEKQSSEEPERSTLLVFSDGVNESVGVSVYDEAVAHLQDAQLPVYAFGLGSDREGLDAFGQLARATGGSFQLIEPDKTDEAVQGATKTLGTNSYTVTVKAPTNEVGGTHELLLKFEKQGVSRTVTVTPEHWIPDTEAPEILSVEQEAHDCLKIRFSEDVSGADDLSHYLLTYLRTDTAAALLDVRYAAERGEYYALLETDGEPIQGDYTLTLSQIHDISQEKNPLKASSIDCTLEGRPLAQADTGAALRIFGIVLAFCILVGALLFAIFHRKKEPAAENAPAAEIPAGDPQQIHVRNPEGVPRTLHLLIRTPNAAAVKMDAVIAEKITVGRAATCQIYFDDPSMSRKHFELDVRGTELWITDCGSLSGTKVNGTLLTAPQQLSQGDVILAGVTEITLRW